MTPPVASAKIPRATVTDVEDVQGRADTRQLPINRVGIKAEQPSAGLQARENFLRVTAVAKRAIHGQFTGLGRKRGENFRDHDGAMRAGGRLAGREYFGDGAGITLRITLLVFLFKPARVLAGIAHAPPMRRHRLGTVRG